MDPVRSVIDAEYSEIKSEQTELLLKWRNNLGKYVEDVTRLDNSRLILAVSNGSLFGVWDLIENKGYEFLVPISIVQKALDSNIRINTQISKLQAGTKYFFDTEHNPVLSDLKTYSRQLIKEMLVSPEYKSYSNEELVIRAIQIAQSHNQNFSDYASLYHQSQ